MEKNVAGQKWVVFAFDITDNSPKTGDAANITGNLRIDGGAANPINDTNPTELEDGYYAFDITQAESDGNLILIAPASSTADVQVIGVPGTYATVAPNSNSLGIESDGDLTKVNTVDEVANPVETDTTSREASKADVSGLSTFNPAVDTIETVNNVNSNADMRGTDSAALASSLITHNDNLGIVEGKVDLIPTTPMRGTDGANTLAPDNATIGSIDAKVDALQIDVTLIRGYEAGDWEILNDQMIFKNEAGAEIARYDLTKAGVPDSDAPDKRVKV